MKRLSLIFTIAGLTLAFFIVRAPHLSQPLVFEEGLFANLFLNNPPGPNYLLIARISGTPLYNPPSHPGPMYKMIAVTGAAAQKLVPRHILEQTFALRTAFSAFSLIPLLIAATFIFTFSTNFRSSLLIFLCYIFARPSILTSGMLQIDNSVGVLLNGIFILGLGASCFLENRRLAAALLFLGATGLGLGKNEWTIIAVAALAATTVLCLIPGLIPPRQLRGLIPLALGLATGNLISIAVDPLNYWSGLDLMKTMAGQHSVLRNHEWSLWARAVMSSLPALKYHAFLAVCVFTVFCHQATTRNLRSPFLAFAVTFSLGSFLSFLTSTSSSNDFRYYAPSLFLMTFTLALFLSGREYSPYAKIFETVFGLVLVAMLFPAAKSFRMHNAPSPASFRRDCINFAPVADLYNRPEFDFIGNGVAVSDAERLAAQAHKPLCPR